MIHLFLLCFFIFVCLLLIASVLLQTGKGGGMAGLGGGTSDSAFGAHTANILQKFTLGCVVSFFALVVILSHTQNKNRLADSSVMDSFVAPKVDESKAANSKEAVKEVVIPASESTTEPKAVVAPTESEPKATPIDNTGTK